MSEIVCPECGSEDVVLGNPGQCGHCGASWPITYDLIEDVISYMGEDFVYCGKYVDRSAYTSLRAQLNAAEARVKALEEDNKLFRTLNPCPLEATCRKKDGIN